MFNVYTVYDLDAWPRNPTNNFKFKNCLFGATHIVKNGDKPKSVYNGYGITFDIAGSWSFGNVLLGMLQFLMLIIVSHLMLIIARIIFSAR